MKVAGMFRRSVARFASMQFALGAVALAGLVTAVPVAQAQAPYLLPYTIQVLAGGGTSVAVAAGNTSPCLGTGTNLVQFDSYGDGCLVTSSSVVAGASSDLHDVVVDQEGNVYFLDNGSNGVVRRIDAHSGLITAYAGSYQSQSGFCTATQDKYGDGCPSADARSNGGTIVNGLDVPSPTTSALGKARGLGVDKAGNVYIADYGANITHKINASTGIMTVVAASLASSTKLSANGGVAGYSGDGALAFNPSALPTPQGAAVRSPRGITASASGDIYIADSGNNVIRLVYNGGAAAAQLISLTNKGITPSVGFIYTVVNSDSNGTSAANSGATGDGGLASAATLTTPEDVEIDGNGNVFIGDFGNNKVRVVYMGGTAVAKLISLTNAGATAQPGYIYTVVGGGSATYSAGTQVLSTSVPIGNPRKLTVDGRSNIFVADSGNDVIWFVDVTTGYMRPIAGSYGSTTPPSLCPAHSDAFGDNCPATTAGLSPNSALGVGIDSLENIYIGDSGNQRVRRVNTNQIFPATAAGATVTQTLEIHFAAGDAPAGSNPFAITGSSDFALASSGAACTTNADTTTDCLVTVNFTPAHPGVDTAVLTAASTSNGSAAFGLSGTGTAAALALDPGSISSLAAFSFSTPQAIAEDAAGSLYIADTGNNRVVKFAAPSFSPVVIAGTGTSGYTGDGAAATAATLNKPSSVAVTRGGLVYIADTGNNVIRVISPTTGFISTVAGAGTTVCSTASDTLGDSCLGTSAILKAPAGLAADANGNVYIADSGNNLIRELTAGGYIFLTGGASAACNSATFGNGCSATGAVFLNPTGIAVDATGNLFVADTGNNQVREIAAATNLVSAVAGTGVAGGSGNGSTATAAQVSGPTGVAVDGAGNVYIADTGNHVIRVVNASGLINTVVGTLGSSGNTYTSGALSSAVLLSSPAGVASSGAGALVVLDSANNRVLTDSRGSLTYNFGRTNVGFSSPTLQIQETNSGNASATFTGASLFTPAPAPPFALGGTGSTVCTTGQTLTPGGSCLLTASFTPSATQLGNFSATYTEATNVSTQPAPVIALSGVGAVLTSTSTTAVVTNPATGNPQYPVPFTVTATVAPASCNSAAPSCVPTGTVTFYVNAVQVGTPVTVSATGLASISIPGQSVGKYSVTAVYSGDLYYASSSAAVLTVTVTTGATTTTVSASPSTGTQFTPLTLTATVTPTSTVKTTSLPTGTVTFFAGTTQLVIPGSSGCGFSSASISPTTGVATLADVAVAKSGNCPARVPNSFGLAAGTYALTAVYSGDANYSPSTSAAGTLIITADAATFSVSLLPSTAGTAQGSTATVAATITPTNTLNGVMGFTCTNLPANSSCTFGPPTTLTFTATPLVPSAQEINITIFTDTASGVTQTTSFLGWPLLFASFAGVFAFRKRLRLLSLLALFGILTSGSVLMTGCSSSNFSTQVTPVGTYTINFVANGPGNVTVTTPITFIVGQGAPGQL